MNIADICWYLWFKVVFKYCRLVMIRSQYQLDWNGKRHQRKPQRQVLFVLYNPSILEVVSISPKTKLLLMVFRFSVFTHLFLKFFSIILCKCYWWKEETVVKVKESWNAGQKDVANLKQQKSWGLKRSQMKEPNLVEFSSPSIVYINLLQALYTGNIVYIGFCFLSVRLN